MSINVHGRATNTGPMNDRNKKRGYVDEEDDGLFESIDAGRSNTTSKRRIGDSTKNRGKTPPKAETDVSKQKVSHDLCQFDNGGKFIAQLDSSTDFFEAERKYRKDVQGRDEAPYGSDLKKAFALNVEQDQKDIATRIYEDPNIKFMGWVAGYCGVIEIKKFMIGRTSGDAPLLFSDELLGAQQTNVEWGHGEKRLDFKGNYILTPVFVSARDEAFDKIMGMSLNRVPYVNPKMTMASMIKECDLNRLFAKLTASIWRQLTMQKPTRYVSERQSQRLVTDERSVKHELIRYFKKTRSRHNSVLGDFM